ncbi:hypothetical protein EV138_3702 [Kribbella voronezhensis]|uniref:Uncharacterized protein n=1 Tax=Kribbella voronezhensis TaxID=2512212 RepID=A0A4R7TEB5_9ACTN|nr:hypothetical protein [Kribbella voronezhensis]TDU90119.1 hypothetical protein EV138_3702 [Kribbella voronezhensis]
MTTPKCRPALGVVEASGRRRRALDEPAGRVPDLVGPEETDAVAMIRVISRRFTRALAWYRCGCRDREDSLRRVAASRTGGFLHHRPVSWQQFLARRLG